MEDEDVAEAVEERRIWLEGLLHQAAERLGTTLSGDNVINTYDMRSAGSRATDQDGTEVWLRVVLSVPDYHPACRWDGNIDANTITGVPKSRVLRWADRHDTTDYRGGNMPLRGEVMTLAPGTAIAPEGLLHHDAATLLCASLQHRPTVTRIREIFQPVLDNHSGQGHSPSPRPWRSRRAAACRVGVPGGSPRRRAC